MANPSSDNLKAQLTDPVLFEAAKLERDLKYNLRTVPPLRVVGLLLLAAAVTFHLKFIQGLDPLPFVLPLLALYGCYGLGSWLVLRAFYQPRARPNWADLFLVLDIGFWMVSLYLTGAEQSTLFFILIVRVADQTNTTFMRCVNFLNISVLAYLLMLVALHLGGRDFLWLPQWTKLSFLYMAGFYVSLTALASQRLKERTRQAVHLAKDTIDELAEQNVELEEARQAAEQVSQMKSEFLATMSHELRTPLNSVIGFCQLLEEPTTGDLNERQKRFLGNSLKSARRLHDLIGNILDLSKLESGGIEVDMGPVDLKLLLHQSVQAMSAQAAAREISVIETYSVDAPLALADGFRMRQVVDNLLSNAIKFNVDGGEVRIALLAREDGSLLFSVEDNGPGIPQAQQTKVFGAFVQLDGGYGRRQEGTGLGLALCRALCDLQSASLSLVSPANPAGWGTRLEVVVAAARGRGGAS